MKRYSLFGVLLLVVAAVVVVLTHTGQARTAVQAAGGITTAPAVSVVQVQRRDIAEQFSLVGTIVANNDVQVVSETQGRVLKILVNVGDAVRAGSVLVEVDSELKEAAYKAAKLNYERSKKDLERTESVAKEGSVSEQQLEQARWAFQAAESQYIVARRQFTDTRITSPIAGVVTSRPVDIGAMVTPGTLVANVVDVTKLKVKVSVPENDVFRLAVGERVTIATEVYAGVTFTGTVANISAKGDDAHTYPVEISLANTSDHPLRAGMFGRVTFAPRTDRALVIPRDAVIGSVRNARVYVVQNNVAKLRPIVAGDEVGTDLEVVSGLEEGEVVVVSGQNNLKDNIAVTIRR